MSGKRLQLFTSKRWTPWKNKSFLRIGLYIVFGAVLFLFMMDNIVPETVDVSINTRAEQAIVSPISIVDEVATERIREEAMNNVSPVYVQDNTITESQIQTLSRSFRIIMETVLDDERTNEQKIQFLQEDLPLTFHDDVYSVLLELNEDELTMLQDVTISMVHDIMYRGVDSRENGIQHALQQVNDALILSSLDAQSRMVAREISRESIVPNYVYDQEETNRLQQEAQENVNEVTIREGEVLVEQGEIISPEIYRQIQAVGLLNDDINWSPYIGLVMLISVLLTFLGVYMHYSPITINLSNAEFFMYITIFVLNVALMKMVSVGQTVGYEGVGFAAPFAFATMLIASLLKQRIAVFSSFLFGIIAGIILNIENAGIFDFGYAFVAMFSSLAGAFFLGKATRKRKIVQAASIVFIVNIFTIFMVLFLQHYVPNPLEVLLYVSFGLISALLAGVLMIGLMPFYEAAFGILSPMKLIELSNPNQPLLRKLLMETPGTYHHSVMVANLAEAATEAVGGDGLLARVGAYYHDVGKTKRPHFFIENQMNMENPHDKIAPQLSKTIITAHAKDGANMLKEHGLPKPIQDIAEQHHGTTLLKYFYHKAQQESKAAIHESEFRYPGPKAQFKESAIIGIADCVEAAVRSLSKPSPERIEHMVRNIIRDRLEDGQFNECDLTLRDLDTIARVICETLKGIFHSRIKYPEMKKLQPKHGEKKEKVENG